MLKKLEDTGHQSVLNKSSIKDIRRSFIKHSKLPQEQFQVIVSKKASMTALKVKSGEEEKKVQIIVVEKQILFAVVQQYVIPILKLVHKYPSLYPKFTCDKGALKFIINGANVMCPGLTHPNASMEDVEKGTIVALYCQGKVNALVINIFNFGDRNNKNVYKLNSNDQQRNCSGNDSLFR